MGDPKPGYHGDSRGSAESERVALGIARSVERVITEAIEGLSKFTNWHCGKIDFKDPALVEEQRKYLSEILEIEALVLPEDDDSEEGGNHPSDHLSQDAMHILHDLISFARYAIKPEKYIEDTAFLEGRVSIASHRGHALFREAERIVSDVRKSLPVGGGGGPVLQ